MASFEFQPVLEDLTCPCGGRVKVGAASSGELGRVPIILHADPFCQDFEVRELNDYLQWLRERLEAN